MANIQSILEVTEALEAYYVGKIKRTEIEIAHLEEEIEHYESLVNWVAETGIKLTPDHYHVDPETIDSYYEKIEGLREEIAIDRTIHENLLEAIDKILKLMELPFKGEQIDAEALWALNVAMRGKEAITESFYRWF